jgi:hypothetical protein
MRARHDAVYMESKRRVLTPAQKKDQAALERRVAGPFVTAMEDAEAARRRDENVAKARIVLLSRLKPVAGQPPGALPHGGLVAKGGSAANLRR